MQPTVFISYSHKDEKEKDALLSHLGVLQQSGLIDLWSDDRIGAGSDWEQEITLAIKQARVAILLVTTNFLTTDFILQKEVPLLLNRQQKEGLIIFPLLARACAWQTVPWLRQMRVRPKNEQLVWGTRGRGIDEDLAEIALEVADINGNLDWRLLSKLEIKPLTLILWHITILSIILGDIEK